MRTVEEDCCANCVFSRTDDYLRCHRNAPSSPTIEESRYHSQWGRVQPFNWCGEYRRNWNYNKENKS